jgi:hypothetical protein
MLAKLQKVPKKKTRQRHGQVVSRMGGWWVAAAQFHRHTFLLSVSCIFFLIHIDIIPEHVGLKGTVIVYS